jgi:hypothetical protein
MVKKAKLALIATVALVGLASPALSQSFDEDDGTGNVLPFGSNRVAFENASHHAAARRNDMNSFAMEPRARRTLIPIRTMRRARQRSIPGALRPIRLVRESTSHIRIARMEILIIGNRPWRDYRDRLLSKSLRRCR